MNKREICTVRSTGQVSYLEKLLKLGNNVRWGTFLFASPDVGAGFQNIAQFVCEIIFAAHCAAVDGY